MHKTYEATTKEEVEAIIIQIIIQKVREMAGDKPIRVNFKGNVYEVND